MIAKEKIAGSSNYKLSPDGIQDGIYFIELRNNTSIIVVKKFIRG